MNNYPGHGDIDARLARVEQAIPMLNAALHELLATAVELDIDMRLANQDYLSGGDAASCWF